MGYEFDFSAIADNLGLLLYGASVTLALTAVAATSGIALSIAGAATSRWGVGWARDAITAYVELIRNTPFIVQLFFIFFGLPSIGLRLSALQAAVLAMTVNLTAYCIEIVRAGIEAVPAGQREAGLALGLRPVFIFFKVVLPQALANIYPALVSQIIITMLEFRRRVADCRNRSDARCRLHPIAHLSRVRNLFCHHAGLPIDGGVLAMVA